MNTTINVTRVMPVVTRTLLASLGALVLLTGTLRPAHAEPQPARLAAWEFQMASGSVVPVGAQRQSIERGGLSTAQLTRIVRPSLALTATAGWARSRDLESDARPKLDIVSGDLGAELRGPRYAFGPAVSLRPIVASGAGVRHYAPRSGSSASDRFTAYAGVGGDLHVLRVGLRLEARDYVTGGESLANVRASSLRHEIAIMAGLRWVSR